MTDDSLLAKLAEEFTAEMRAQKPVDIEKYACQYPELAGRIRELFPTLMLLEGMAGADTGASANPPGQPVLSPDSVFGQYRIKREIGRGGMGIVHEAVHLLLEKRVALKVLSMRTPTDAGHLERFFREAKTAAGLHHTNIVPVFDVGQVGGTPYYAMEYIEGRGLDAVLRIMQPAIEKNTRYVSAPNSERETVSEVQVSSEREIQPDEKEKKPVYGSADPSARILAGLPARSEEYFRWVAGVGIQAAGGLAHAHERKVIHRDIKPSNLLLDNRGVLWITDFGLARRIEDPTVTQSGILIGTPRYMSPEQAEATKRPLDQRSDIYSLGATLYELLTCRPVFEGKTPHDVISQILTRSPVAPRRLNAEIPVDLSTIVMKAMAKRPEDRYPSADQLGADLGRWLKMEPIKARRIGPAGRTIRWCRRNPRLAAVSAAAALIILILSGIYYAGLMKENANTRLALQRETEALHRTEAAIRKMEVSEQQAKAAEDLANKSRQLAESERDHAKLEAERSQAEVDILQGLFLEDSDLLGDSSSNIIAGRVRNAWDMHKKSLIGNDAGLARFAVNLLREVDVTANWGSGDKTAALKLRGELELEAVRLVNRAIAAGDISILETVNSLIVYLEQDQRNPEQKALVARLWRSKLDLRRKTGPRGLLIQELEKFAEYLENKGRKALEEDRFSEAEANFRELLKARLEINPPGSGWTYFPAIAKGFLGESLRKLNRYAEAEPFLLESFKVLDSRDARLRLIALYEAWGKTAKAEQYRRDLLVESVRELGPIGTMEVRDMDLGSSIYFANRSVWVFKDWLIHSNVPAGQARRQNRWAWTDDLNASEGINLRQPPLKSDRDRELIHLTPDEQAFNKSHEEQWVLWPGSMASDPERNRALVAYTKVLAIPDNPGRRHVGFSLAVWPHPDAEVTRPILRPGSEYPTMLFQGDEPNFGMGAVTDNDFLYLYASSCQPLDCGTMVARAPLSAALDRSAWRFYSGQNNWVEDWKLALQVLNGASELSVHWNQYLGKYLAVYTPALGSGIAFQTADCPEGPWSGERLILEGVRSAEGRNNRQALGHPEFAGEDGRVEYVTYLHPTGEFGRDIRLVEITFK